MSIEQKIKNFDPNSVAGSNSNIFGLPFTPEEARIVLIPVPWDVTVSYHAGASRGPAAILQASRQVDLLDPLVKECWKIGVAMEKISTTIQQKNSLLRKRAIRWIRLLEKQSEKQNIYPSSHQTLIAVNKGCQQLQEWVKKKCDYYLRQDKIIGIVGGDHSTPLGLICALVERYSSFGILQIDAHCDLRKHYEGFLYSHASIMYNVLQHPEIKKLIQVGIRDWCEEEETYIRQSKGRIVVFFDHLIKKALFSGKAWEQICKKIITALPREVYVSIDIDGLEPAMCPGTGTPVPGGLQIEQVVFLLELLVKSGRKIIGFDLCEVAPTKDDREWNGNVGARILFRLCNLTAISHQIANWRK